MQQKLSQWIKEEAKNIGFHLVAITGADCHPDFEIYQQWIQKDGHADMQYLKRHLEKKSDPRHILSSAKSIICCALSYKTSFQNGIPPKDCGLISNYAWGQDYHFVMGEKLELLFKKIKSRIPSVEGKWYSDTGPILERSFANRAGLGWIGKNTCLINPDFGSYIFLGEILINLELDLDSPQTDHCGSCTKCLKACPTGALSPYELNVKDCISYLTIEKRGPFNEAEKSKVSHYVFGCDICQEVCPWNHKAKTPHLDCFGPRKGLYQPFLKELQSMSQEEFGKKFLKSPIQRAGFKGFKRNIEAVLNE